MQKFLAVIWAAALIAGAAAADVTLTGTVVDADSRQPIPCRVHVEGPDGEYFAPEGHVELDMERRYNNGIDYEPDVINSGWGVEKGECWAMLEDGTFTIELPSVDGIRLKVQHGFEYEVGAPVLDLADHSGNIERTFALKRGVNMRERGWMSGDTHVHNLTPIGAVRQMKVEDLDYVNLMFMSTGSPLYSDGHFIGKPSPECTAEQIVYVSRELRDAQQGHLTTLNIKDPVEPIVGYTGQQSVKEEPRPNEPFNWEVWERLHSQGGLVFHAHYTHWPGYASTVCGALGKIDGFEFSQPDIVVRGPQTRLNIEVPGYEKIGGGPIWYHMLNCGARVPLCGGTDKMSAHRIVGGAVRCYAKVDEFGHQGFIDALAAGRTFVTNAPLLDLTVNGQGIGSDVRLSGGGPFKMTVKASCHTEKPLTYFQIVKNGEVIHDQTVAEGEKDVSAELAVDVSESCWFAVRAGNKEYSLVNWGNGVTAAHSSPIYVTVNGELPAVKESAEFMVARAEVDNHWCQALAMYSSEENKARAVKAFEQSQRFYQAALERAIR